MKEELFEKITHCVLRRNELMRAIRLMRISSEKMFGDGHFSLNIGDIHIGSFKKEIIQIIIEGAIKKLDEELSIVSKILEEM